MDPTEEKTELDKIENELYNPYVNKSGVNLHTIHTTKTEDLPTSWLNNSTNDNSSIKDIKPKEKMSFGAKLLLVSSVILLIAISFTAWKVLSSRNVVSSANIDMAMDIAPYAEGGEEVPLILTLGNHNTVPLQEATVTLMYEQGLGTQDQQQKISDKRNIGTIQSNGYARQDFKIVLYGSEADSRDIVIKLEYKVAGSNALFSKVVMKTVILKTPPISVHIDGPSTLSLGQNGSFTITVKNNTSTTTLPSALQVNLPSNFKVSNLDPASSGIGTVWNIPPLEHGEIQTIGIDGYLTGFHGEQDTIKAQIGSLADNNSIGVVYATQSFDISLKNSPITMGIVLNTDRGVANSLRYGDNTNILLSYKNDSTEPLRDVSLKLSILGNAAITKDINPNEGYYDSEAQTIVWDKTSVKDLEILNPQDEGNLNVSIPVVLQGTNSPELKIILTATASSKNVNDIVTSISKSWVVQGSASLSAKTYYKNSPFKNTGPIPPRPNTDTTYTAHLIVSSQNALENAVVSFSLPLYVTWLNTTSDNNIIYDSRKRTVTWSIGSIDANKTISADIGLSVRPSQSHINQSPAITSGIVLDANESVSRAHINTTISPLTTFISEEKWPSDPSYVVGN